MKVELTEKDKKLMQKLADIIISRRLTAVAVFLLESCKPLNFLGSQFMVFIQPFVQTFLELKEYDRVAELIEDRDNVEFFIQVIEDTEANRKKKKKVEKNKEEIKAS